MSGGRTHKVVFAPSGRVAWCPTATTVLDAAREAGVYLEAACGGAGTCGKCKVRILDGDAGRWTAKETEHVNREEKERGYRLACKAAVREDLKVFIPTESVFKAQPRGKSFKAGKVRLNPAISACTIDLKSVRCGGSDPQSFFTSLVSERCGKHGLSANEAAVDQFAAYLKTKRHRVTALLWMDREIIQAQARKPKKLLGIALDLGTTTVALYVCDLTTGKIIASGAASNPQIVFGEDVVARINYSVCHPDSGLERMRSELLNAVNSLIEAIAADFGFVPQDVVDMTVVGNTVMHHIFLGLTPDGLGRSPFTPSIVESVDVRAGEIGIGIYPDAYVHVLPVEAGFVGADNVGVLISEKPYLQQDPVLIMDLGTNGELVAGNKAHLFSCSCATGPALEGAQIKWGMRAVTGAIERVAVDPVTFDVRFKSVGNKGWSTEARPGQYKAAGICGSGIVDAVAELYKYGLLEKSGAFSKNNTTQRLRKGPDDVTEFVLVWAEETAMGKDIVITQHDVRQIQLAKAALQVGCNILMKRLNISRFSRILVAGAFGMHIDVESGLAVGLFPPCERGQVSLIGNAAGRGAYLALTDKSERAEADRVARWVQHVELATDEGFREDFLEGLAFPERG